MPGIFCNRIILKCMIFWLYCQEIGVVALNFILKKVYRSNLRRNELKICKTIRKQYDLNVGIFLLIIEFIKRIIYMKWWWNINNYRHVFRGHNTNYLQHTHKFLATTPISWQYSYKIIHFNTIRLQKIPCNTYSHRNSY